MLMTLMVAAAVLIPLWLAKVAGKALWQRLFGEPLMAGQDIRSSDGVLTRMSNAAIGIASPVGNPTDNLSTIFAFGRKQPKQEGHTTVFRAPVGWKYGFCAVVGFLVYFCFHFERTANAPTPWDMYVIGAAMLGYMAAYIWRFRVTIDGTQLTAMNFFFATFRYDLTLMLGARRTKDGYKLYFSDGRVARLPLFIEGHDVLIQFLSEELEANGY
ncbi:MAG: hypothetical protein AAF601_15505 [Pseudomonadota bacterium]